MGWSDKRMVEFDSMTVRKLLQVAKRFDTCPTTIDVFGQNVLINDPRDPRSMISNFLEEPSKVVIGLDAVRMTDAETEKLRRMQVLERLAPYAQAGAIPIAWLVREMITAAGEDPDEVASYAAPMEETLPGQPGEMATPVA
jgi:hypothetical protein